MATTKIKKSISKKEHLKNALDYISNLKKTDNGVLITSLNCSKESAYQEFLLTNLKFGKNKCEEAARDKWIAHHAHQNFPPDEKITPELAHEIGVQLAKELYSDYQCIVSTHIDKAHIHNHIIFNSVSFLDGKKYHKCTKNAARLRIESDRLCREYGLQVLEKTELNTENKNHFVGNGKSTPYHKTDVCQNEKKESMVFKIKRDIDLILENKEIKTFDKFLEKMNEIGYQVKWENVKHIAFLNPGASKFIRGTNKGFGEGYSYHEICQRIEKNKEIYEKKEEEFQGIQKDYYSYIKIQHISIIKLSKSASIKNSNGKYFINVAYKRKLDQLQKQMDKKVSELNFMIEKNIKTINEVENKIEELKKSEEVNNNELNMYQRIQKSYYSFEKEKER